MCFSSILAENYESYLINVPFDLLVLIKNFKFEPGVKTCINCSRMNTLNKSYK